MALRPRPSLLAVLVIEVVLTAVFLYVILGATDTRAPKCFAPIAIGLSLTLIHLASIPVPVPVPPGNYVREWRIAGSSLDRALGRPIRDQVYTTRDAQATTIQALELVNGERLTHWLWRGARRMLGETTPQ